MYSGAPSSTISTAFLPMQKSTISSSIIGIGNIHDVERNCGVAIDIGKAELLKGAHDAIVHAAEHDDADVALGRAEKFVELALLDKVDGSWPALLELVLFMKEVRRRQHDAVNVAHRVFQCLLQR